MKAYEVQDFGIENLRLTEIPTPKAGYGEVVVKIKAISVNYRDLMVVSGTYNPRMKRPAIPFSDASGEIVEVGPGVTRWKVGDRVLPIFVQRWFDGRLTDQWRRTALGAGSDWNGVLREYAAFSEESIVEAPEHLSFEEAATLPCAALTAWNGLVESGRLRAGETVLTLGTGGVSIFALQIAKMFGARVISTTGNNHKAERLRELGADEIINYRETENWDDAVLQLTAKRGVDHVIEVGGAGTLSRSSRAVAVGGHIALIGALSGGEGLSPIGVFMKAVRLQGIFVGSRRMLEDMNRAFAFHRTRPVIDTVFPFDRVAEALRYMESAQHFGKIVIAVG
ncbi:MAG: NAD(P)-dependent alcohol dehydrogenase [Blastocatellia bacterium]